MSEQFESNELLANVNKIFTTLRISYPAWYEKYYGEKVNEKLAKRIWTTGIKSLTTQQINKGLQRLVTDCEYPPNLHTFLKLCSDMKDVPSLEVAWGQALVGQFGHLLVKKAAQQTGQFELQRSGYENVGLKKRFAYFYLQLVESAMAGLPLTEISQALEQQTNLLTKTEQASEKNVEQRIQQQGIDRRNARAQCLALLGIKH